MWKTTRLAALSVFAKLAKKASPFLGPEYAILRQYTNSIHHQKSNGVKYSAVSELCPCQLGEWTHHATVRGIELYFATFDMHGTCSRLSREMVKNLELFCTLPFATVSCTSQDAMKLCRALPHELTGNFNPRSVCDKQVREKNSSRFR